MAVDPSDRLPHPREGIGRVGQNGYLCDDDSRPVQVHVPAITHFARSFIGRSGRELMANVRGYLRSTQQQPKQLRRYFHRRSVRCVAAMSKRCSLAQ